MNTTDGELRMQLRGLRRDIEPATDLWPGIQARLAPARKRPKAIRLAPWALAASLVLATGIAWKMQPSPGVVEPDVVPASANMDREAAAMAFEYRAALQELQASMPRRGAAAAEQPGLRELDHGARQIRDALARDPESRFLLERLRRTYALRLALTQRAITQRASVG